MKKWRSKKMLFLLCVYFFASEALASGLTISEVQLKYERGKPFDGISNGVAEFTVQWDNAWHNSKNHDAAWIFLNLHYNYNLPTSPLLVAKDGHRVLTNFINGASVSIKSVRDLSGFFILPGPGYRGSVKIRILVALDSARFLRAYTRFRNPNLNPVMMVEGLEMVYIPQGKFSTGDTSKTAVNEYNAYYRSDANGNPAGFYEITDEKQTIPIGKKDGSIFYKVNTKKYQGDQSGPVGPSFPKGYQAFYIMKYELTQGQYTRFLNVLNQLESSERSPFGGREYYKLRGTIAIKASLYVAASPNRPFNWSSWDDGMAYADWSRLRPITELEFIKASRGPEIPLADGYVWGTNSKEKLARYINPDGDLTYKNNENEKDLTDNNRDVFGASYYWVMDLSGSVWERCVTIGDSAGRAFTGTHGDGVIYEGYATNRDWPKGNNEYGGFGFRGGGYYTQGDADRHVPHSPIEYRRYGAWAGGYREVAYGQRFARTAEW
jgi:formylglycine-generating enzyme required for sulfatase activity